MSDIQNTKKESAFCSEVMSREVIEKLRDDPRASFKEAIRKRDAASCLVKTAEIHGHYCPGSALGVMATLYGLSLLEKDSLDSDGIMENLLAIVEVNACFTDGVQAVSGCTLGNNSLIYRDLGKHAVTFTSREEKTGIRVRLLPDFRRYINEEVPDFYPLMDKVIMKRKGTQEEERLFREKAREAAFAIITHPFEELFASERVMPVIPDRAPITGTMVCPECGEEVMETKTGKRGLMRNKCHMCSGRFQEVNGQGIVMLDLRNHGFLEQQAIKEGTHE